MFAGRNHDTLIELAEDEERLYRLPPISEGPVIIRAFDAYTTRGPHDSLVFHTGPTGELDLELRHSEHLKLPFPNFILTELLWFDDLWRLRVKRRRTSPDPSVVFGPRQYRIEAQYTSQLPVLERRVGARFFHEGFEANWNRQRYLKIRLIGNRIQVLVQKDLAALYDIEPEASDISSGFVTAKSIDTGRLSFTRTVDITSLRLDVGAGSLSFQGGNMLFFSVHGEVPKVDIKVDLPDDKEFEIAPFRVDVRFYLTSLGKLLAYTPTIESNLLDRLDFSVPTVGNVKDLLKKAIEDALYKLQVSAGTASTFGEFLGPWLVGGTNELFSLDYAPGPGDQLRPDGIVEPATGELIVRYVGPKRPPDRTPVLTDSTGPSTPPVDDGAIPLFDVPDEEPDPEPGTPGGTSPIGGGPFGHGPLGRPRRVDVGPLAKVDHIVVLMQENRSFDQVLGYLRRDRGRVDVDGLLPPGVPGSERQRNRFANTEFLPTRATAATPKRNAATAWPSFDLIGPGHDSEDVVSQMADDMGGFVSNFARRLGLTTTTDPTAVNLRLVTDYFDDTDLLMYGLLAREFAICDHWYTAHAGPTWPNRFVTISGDLNRDRFGTVEVDNPDFLKLIPLQRPSLFDLLEDRGVSWRVYEHGYSFPRLFRNHTFDTTDIVPFDDPVRGFEGAARSGALPSVTFIEPDYVDLPPGNDDHPPADMAGGQVLVRRIVESLIASTAFERTLFVITYDEHGGFYDHVQPPNDAAPLGGSFTKLGPRVPTFLVSPLVERGATIHDRFDHTTIGATILRRFCSFDVPRVSPRMDAAKDLRTALTRADSPRPRSEFDQLVLPTLPVRPPSARARRSRTEPVGPPKTKDDFHGLLAAVRLTTGQAPRQTGALRRKPRPSASGELLFYRDRTQDGTGDLANPSVIGLGGWAAFKGLFGGGGGRLYAIDRQGRLLLYRDRNQDGTGDVADSLVLAPSGWQAHRFVFSGGDGIVYAVDAQGRLLYHSHTMGAGPVALSQPAVIGRGGWAAFSFLLGGGDGIIYAVDAQGRLLFYRDRARNGTGDVVNPSVIGLGGWGGFKRLLAGGNGILYAVDSQGRLLFYRDRARDGTGDVANPSVIGLGGWGGFKHLCTGGNGILYAVRR